MANTDQPVMLSADDLVGVLLEHVAFSKGPSGGASSARAPAQRPLRLLGFAGHVCSNEVLTGRLGEGRLILIIS
eukprot:3492130-Rhodomonas_salina.1